jgi:small GTP-binding protein
MQSFSPSIRLLTLGDNTAGKSSLIEQYTFNEFNQDIQSTIGIDFRTKSAILQGIHVHIQIWDTAGQERFRTITRNYYRGAKGILLMYSIIDKESFDSLDRWYREIQTYAEDGIPIALIGTKLDLNSKRQVSREQGQIFASNHGFLFFETSAKTGAHIEEAIEALATKVLKAEMTAKIEKSVTLSPEKNSSSCCY